MSPSASVAAPFIETVPWVFTLLIVWVGAGGDDRGVVRVDVDVDAVLAGVELVVDAEAEGEVDRAAARRDEPLVGLNGSLASIGFSVTAGPAVWVHWYERIWPVSGSVAEPCSVTVAPPLVVMSVPAFTAGVTLAPTE